MPSLATDWEAVKTLAVAVGVREAARRMGLKQSTVKSQCTRERWLASLPRDVPLPPTVQARASNASKSPSTALAESLREMAQRTRLGHARAAQAVAKHVETFTGEEALTAAPLILQSVRAASLVYGWSAGSNGQQSVRLDLVAGSQGCAVRLEMGGEGQNDEDDE